MKQSVEKKLKKYFGFNDFLKGQREVIEMLIARQSAVAIFPTGGGKSLCYQLTALILPGITLVVSPLLSLMKDQLDFLSRKNIPAAKLDSTMDREDYNNVLKKARDGSLKILMISVERFKNERFRIQLKGMKISLLVVDEAHCISEWGHNFRPEYLKIPLYKEEFGVKQILLLTATATPRVRDDMCTKFNVLEQNVVITGFYRKNLFLKVTPVREDEKDSRLLTVIRKNNAASTIVYVTLQKTAERVAEMLTSNGVNAMPYHAGLQNDERTEIQNKFMGGNVPVVVATIAFGMGIDKKDIRTVVHYDIPKSIEGYSQEIGRAGRDGKNSLCEVLANRDNIQVLENFIYGDTPTKPAIRKLLEIVKSELSGKLEIKIYSLSFETDIRLLPLKTLLVYLEMKSIISPKYIYFEKYTFKFIDDAADIINKFDGERKEFVQTIFHYSDTAKIWTKIDVESVMVKYDASRERIIKALEYFEEKGWIELSAAQSVEGYDITNNNFDVDIVSEELFVLVQQKEIAEIKRIHDVVDFFESDVCLSERLSKYFGEDIQDMCGHCSTCCDNSASVPVTMQLMPLTEYDFKEVTREFLSLRKNIKISPVTITRFLCGVNSPILTKLRTKKLQEFGILGKYPYKEVEAWVVNKVKGDGAF